MSAPRTSTIVEAAATVRDQVTTALSALPGGGDASVRDALLHYLAVQQAERMFSEILADVPDDVAVPLRERMLELASRIRGAVQV